MERRIIVRISILIAAALLAGLFLGACSNPFDILAAIQTDVKRANNKFLLVSDSGPDRNATAVNPSDPIWIEFDRDLDTDTITPESITFTPAATCNFSFNETDRKLSISATLDGLVEYKVTVTKAVLGVDGSTLENDYSWSFSTANLPSGNIVINSGSAYINPAGSNVALAVTYNSVVAEMRYSWNKSQFSDPNWGWVAKTPTIPSVALSNTGIGTHTMYIQFRDVSTLNLTGNPNSDVNFLSDSILNGAVTLSPCLNTAALGTVTLSWTPATRQDSGTNIYRVYQSTPTVALIGETGESSLNFSVTQGSFNTYAVKLYNGSVGGEGSASNTACGFSSNIVVVYNKGNTADETSANNIKTALTTDWPNTYPDSLYTTGTMPVWTVTLLPQSYVSTTAASANVVRGKPVIITPNTTLWSYTGQTYNVTAYGNGVIAMGEGGARLLDTVTTNWAGFGFAADEQKPNEIGYSHSTVNSTESAFMYTWTTNNSVWEYPLQTSSFPGGPSPVTHNASIQISYLSLSRVSVSRPADTAPTGGYIFGRDNTIGGHYYTVVKQGRFLQFGFNGMTDRHYTGYIYFVNLTKNMIPIIFRPPLFP